MSGFGFTELFFLFLLILLLFGPKELPKLARFVARLIYQMKNIFQRLEKEWNLKDQDKSSLSNSQQEFLHSPDNKNRESKESNE